VLITIDLTIIPWKHLQTTISRTVRIDLPNYKHTQRYGLWVVEECSILL